MVTHAISKSTIEPLSASGQSSEKLSLPALQSKMKCDPEGYISELVLIYNQFKSSLELFEQQAALSFTSISGIGSDPTVAKDLGDRAIFLAHVTPFYSEQLSEFPKKLADLLRTASHSLPSGLRSHITQALILLINRKIVDIEETLSLFMELQTIGDRPLRKLAFSHVVHSIRRMNKKHKNETKNRALQNILFGMLKQEDEAMAKRALVTLCDLHRRKVWFDERTANAICSASFHPSSKIAVATISFLLDYEKIVNDEESDGESSDEETIHQSPQVSVSKEAIYKAHHKGTAASKRKKQAKLQRVMRNLKRQQRRSSENSTANYYSPLNHLKDAQGFAEKLFSRLQTCNERFEIRMMMLKVVARTVGLHCLVLMNFYPYLQKYVQPHQRDVTDLLAAAVQTCHDMVPPDAVEPLFKQIVNQFVHDRSRPESIAVGLNVIREICMRMPLLMTEDLLQDLALYKKSHEKAVSIAARSLITLFREVCPSLLVKKDRGRPADTKARPKAYGEVSVAINVPGIELLQNDDHDEQEKGDDNSDISIFSGSDEDDQDNKKMADCGVYEENELGSDSEYADDDDVEDSDSLSEKDEEQCTYAGNSETSDDEEDGHEDSISDEDVEDDKMVNGEDKGRANTDYSPDSCRGVLARSRSEMEGSSTRKRKFSNIDKSHISADRSLRALKKIATEAFCDSQSEPADGILSNEDFQKIKELKAKKEINAALTQHGLLKSTKIKIPTADQLRAKPIDPAMLEIHVRPKLSKEERLALVRAGREENGKYQARTAVKQKKTGGSSNKQKQGKKKMPLAAQRHKAAKSRQEKKKKLQRSGKQFRGKKAWK